MKLVITGINGFVGGCMANYFISKGHEVTGIGRQNKLADFIDPKCQYIYADITKPIAELKADVFIHAAAFASDTAPYSALQKNNIQGTANVLNAAASANNFIQISTSSVYKFGEQPMKENEAGKQFEKLSPYGQTKFLAEKKVLEDNRIPFKHILRPRAIYGINDRLILPRLLKLVKGKKLVLPSHITSQISLTHIDNLITAAELCILSPQKYAVFNVADDKIYYLEEVIKSLIKEVTSEDLNVKKISKPIWEFLININCIIPFNKDLSRFGSDQLTKPGMMDISAIKKEMHYQPKRIMETSCREIGDWIKKNGGWKAYLQRYESLNKSRH